MLIPLYRNLGFLYISVGDWEKTESLIRTMKQIHPQYGSLATMIILAIKGEYSELLQAAEKHVDHYPENKDGYYYKASSLIHHGRTQEAEDYLRTMLQYGEHEVNTAHRGGIILWKNGKRDEAMEYFNIQMNCCTVSIELKDLYGHTNAAYDLAGVYAFLGKKEEAIRWLREYEKLGFRSGMQEYIKIDPLFDKLRNDEAFKEIVSRANDKVASLRAEMQQMEEY